MTLATRLDKLETLWGGGDCPVCHGQPPFRVRYVNDWRAEPGPETPPCPGCGGVREIEVAYVEEWRRPAP